MKKILSLILCLMLSCSLVGCGPSDGSSNIKFENISGRVFMRVRDSEYILVDITQRTQYLVYYDSGIGGMTLLVDSEGKPLLYEGEIPYGNQ